MPSSIPSTKALSVMIPIPASLPPVPLVQVRFGLMAIRCESGMPGVSRSVNISVANSNPSRLLVSMSVLEETWVRLMKTAPGRVSMKECRPKNGAAAAALARKTS